MEVLLNVKGVINDMIFLFQIFAVVEGARERDFVLSLWRHGARSPKQFFPQFSDNDEKWPNRNMQLSDLGIQQHKDLGKFLRNRFLDLFPLETGYKRKDLYVRSSDTGEN